MADCLMHPIRIALLSSRCWCRRIIWITCILRTETVTNCYVNKQIDVSVLSTNIKLLYTSFDILTPSVTDRLLSSTAFCGDIVSLLQQLCTLKLHALHAWISFEVLLLRPLQIVLTNLICLKPKVYKNVNKQVSWC